MKPTSVKVRRKFDETFKREAVNHWLASGKSAEVIGQELGLEANRLYAWKKRLPRVPANRFGTRSPLTGPTENSPPLVDTGGSTPCTTTTRRW